MVVGMEPIEKENGYCIVNMNVEREVETACPIVTSALRVDDYPGALADKLLRMLTVRRWVLGLAFMTAPMLGFCS